MRAKSANESQGRHGLQRSFSTFPDRRPGIGLLLLRATVGTTAVIQGVAYLACWGNLTFGPRVVGLLAVTSGCSLLIGFLTPLAVALVGLGSAGIALSWFPAPTPNLLNSGLAAFFVVIMAAAIVFLGPGAVSLDARLFGRREIIIPPTSRSPKS